MTLGMREEEQEVPWAATRHRYGRACSTQTSGASAVPARDPASPCFRSGADHTPSQALRQVLVVDSDPDVGELVAHSLRRRGYTVTLAQDAARALELLRVELPALVVLDPALPLPEGLRLCRQIRTSTMTPVLLVSTHACEDDIRQGLAAGAEEVVRKPFSPRHLVERVHAILERQRQHSGAS